MEFSKYRITLDMHDISSQVMLNVKQGDSARKIYIGLSDGGKPYMISADCTAVLRAMTPADTILFNDCIIQDNVIEYELTNLTCESVGIVECELILYGADSAQITSPRFSLMVDGIISPDGEVEGTNEFTALANALSKVGTLDDTVEAVINSAKEAAEIASSEAAQKTSEKFTEAVITATTVAENATDKAIAATEIASAAAKSAEENANAALDATDAANDAAAKASEAAKVMFEYGCSHVVTLYADGWEHDGEKYLKTIELDGLLANDSVIVAPSPGSVFAYGKYAIVCVEQTDGELTFAAQTQPQENTLVYIMVITEREAQE